MFSQHENKEKNHIHIILVRNPESNIQVLIFKIYESINQQRRKIVCIYKCLLYGVIQGWGLQKQFVLGIIDIHDDVIKWKHFPRYSPFVRGIHRSPVNNPHKGQWRWALMFSLICARINGWVKTREAGDLRWHRAHYDVIVMTCTHTWYGHTAHI